MTDILVDTFHSNNAWAKTYKGHLIMRDGRVMAYDLTKEWLKRDLTLAYKLAHSHETKVLSDEVMLTLRAYASTVSDEEVHAKRRGFDMGNGYVFLFTEEQTTPSQRITLRHSGGESYVNQTSDKVPLLLALIDQSVSDERCSQCQEIGQATLLCISPIAESRLFCSTKCYALSGCDSSMAAATTTTAEGGSLATQLWVHTDDAIPLLSPFSIHQALLLLYLGSGNGRATRALAQLLRVADRQRTLQCWLETNRRVRAEQAVEFINGNLILYRGDARVDAAYAKAVGEFVTFGAFRSADEARQRANTWCATQTHSLIKECLTAEDVTRDTMAILINAIYFKAQWSLAFRKESTRDGVFTQLDGKEVQRPLMHQMRHFAYCEDADAQYIKLYYEAKGGERRGGNSAYYMFIALPRPEKQQQQQQQRDVPSSDAFTIKKVALTLPKFEQRVRCELNQLLKTLGLGVLFGDESDVSGVLRDAPLKISTVIHEVVVRVDEEGTEAAAVTAVVMEKAMMARPVEEEIVVFDAVRPFYYAIVDGEHDDTLLFMGLYNGQQQS
jgi:serpin B